MIGRKFSDSFEQNDKLLWPFEVISGPRDKPMITVTYKGEQKQFFAEEISSMVLLRMKDIAEKCLGAKVRNAVIAVPANYNYSQRQAIRDAATIAGLKVLQIIAEPTAAALAYGFDKKRARRSVPCNAESVLVFDLGADNCNVSLLTIEDNSLKVKATAGASHLGGEDIVNHMVNHFVQKFMRINKKDITGNAKSMRRLRDACQKAKKDLSCDAKAKISLDCLYGGTDFSAVITRKRFNELNMGLFKSCLELVERCLSDAGMDKRYIDEVVTVGGSTRIPKVRQLLKEFFHGKELCTSINADEAVAYGATVQAAYMSNKMNARFQDIVLKDSNPLSINIEINGEMSVIFFKNYSLPASRKLDFSTIFDNQVSVLIQIFEGDHTMPKHNKLLRKSVFSGIPPAPSGVSEYSVFIDITVDGLLKVSAKNKNSGQLEETKVPNEEDPFSKMELEKLIRAAEKYKAEDEENKKKMEARNFVESYFIELENIISDQKLSSKLAVARKKKMEDAIEMAKLWSKGNQFVKFENLEIIAMELKDLAKS